MPAERDIETSGERGKQEVESGKWKKKREKKNKEGDKKTAPCMSARRWRGLCRYPS
jgi:hypothetical protein